ncbi:hypothetical protein BDF19DRAFT_412693 [Syncephalis fuscata]|nr:hypothetical protein BDF19DRAFT_412693 [Syncephalis fuscata]
MADRVLDSMIKSSTKPKEANRHFLVDTHTSVSTATTAIPMHKMPTPSLRTFKIVMGAHARYKRWWAVIRWWRRWQQYLKQNSLYDTTNVKICPDTIAYSMAIQALKAVGRLQEAQRLVDDATKQGLLRNT